MKTVIIYDQLDAELNFVVIDKDVTHLNGVYINSCALDDEDEDEFEAKQDELSALFYEENGKNTELCNQLTTEFPVQAVRDGAAVIVCGFLP